MATDFVENKIYSDEYDLFSRALYGGIGHGVIIFPTYIFKIIFTVIFPPIGQLLNTIEDYLLDEFPYITWDTIKALFDFENLNNIIYSYLLTSLFYVPGLVYTLANLTMPTTEDVGIVECDIITDICTPVPTGTVPSLSTDPTKPNNAPASAPGTSPPKGATRPTYFQLAQAPQPSKAPKTQREPPTPYQPPEVPDPPSKPPRSSY